MTGEELKYLIEKLKSKDRSGIADFIRAYHPAVSSMIRKYAPQNADYKSLEMKAFTKAVSNIDTLKDPSGIENWLDAYVRQTVYEAYPETAASVSRGATVLLDDDEGEEELSGASFTPNETGAMRFDPETGAPLSQKQSAPEMRFDPNTGKPLHQESSAEMRFDPETGKPLNNAGNNPRRQNEARKAKKTAAEYERDEDQYDDEDEPSGKKKSHAGFIILIIILAVIFGGGFVLYRFVPETWNSIAERISFLPTADSGDSSTSAETAPASSIPEETEEPAVIAETPAAASQDAALESAAPVQTEIPVSTPSVQPQGPQIIGSVTVNVSRLNIREEPDRTSKSLGHVEKGKTYDVYDFQNAGGYTWYEIGTDQWIADDGSWVTYTAG